MAILSCNCEATQTRRIFNKVDTEPKVVTEILCLGDSGKIGVRDRVGVRVELELIILGTLSLYYYAHSISPC